MRIPSVRCVGFAIVLTLPASRSDSAAPAPDFTGLWARQYIGFEPPESGPGPIVNRTRLPSGQSSLSQFVGDYTSPILKPHAAAIVKKHGEIELGGGVAPNPSNQCLPMSPPYILQRQQVQVVQQTNQITLLYVEDHQVRRVRLNAQHPPHVTPSWYGDSVGRFDGDTLIVDTVGIKVGPHSMVDSFGTPYSEALHVVERYRLIDYDAGAEAARRGEREVTRLAGDSLLGNGVSIDPEYKGKALQVQFTVEDENTFTMPWSAITTYWRASGDWMEKACAENTNEFGQRKELPMADRPDF